MRIFSLFKQSHLSSVLRNVPESDCEMLTQTDDLEEIIRELMNVTQNPVTYTMSVYRFVYYHKDSMEICINIVRFGKICTDS